MEDPKRELLEQTKQFWQARTQKPFPDEDAREMIENITCFFKVLIEWDKKAKDRESSSNK